MIAGAHKGKLPCGTTELSTSLPADVGRVGAAFVLSAFHRCQRFSAPKALEENPFAGK